MFKWLHSKENQAPQLTIELCDDGTIRVKASWTKPETADDFSKIIRQYVSFLLLMKDTNLFPILQHAISIYGKNHNDDDCAKAILVTLHKVLKDDSSETKDRGTRPLVRPTEAFHKQ